MHELLWNTSSTLRYYNTNQKTINRTKCIQVLLLLSVNALCHQRSNLNTRHIPLLYSKYSCILPCLWKWVYNVCLYVQYWQLYYFHKCIEYPQSAIYILNEKQRIHQRLQFCNWFFLHKFISSCVSFFF